MKKKDVFKSVSVFMAVLCCIVSLWAGPADSRQKPAAYRIYMVLWRGVTDAEKGFIDYFSQQGIDADFMIRNCQKDRTKFPLIIEEIKRLEPDLVYTFGTTAALSIAGTIHEKEPQRFIRDMPVVCNIVADPLGAGLVSNLETPGRNLTGVSHAVPVLAQVERMKALFNVRRIGVIYSPQEKNSLLEIKNLEKLSGSRHYTLIKMPLPVDGAGKLIIRELSGKVAALAGKNPDIIYFPSDSMVISNAGYLVELIDRHRLPGFSVTEGPIRNSGVLMGLVSSYYDMGKFAASRAEQILVHKKSPAEIPFRMLSTFSFLVNKKAARQLNYKLPEKLVKYAEIVE
jgi:putative ABC transport system substrate-binding protein